MGACSKAWALCFGLTCLLGAKAASAQPSIDARTWRPSTDPGASLVLEPPQVQARGGYALGAYANYTHRPIILFKKGSEDVAYTPLAHVAGMDLGGSYGIMSGVAIGAQVPVTVYQTGTSGLPAGVVESGRVPASGVGDIQLSLKGNLSDNHEGGFGLAMLSGVSLPTGDTQSFMGEGAVTAHARALAEYSLVFAAVQGSLGYKIRTERRTWPKPDGVRIGDELPWSFGLSLRPSLLGVDEANRQRVEIALHGALPAGPVGPFGAGEPGSRALSPVMIAVSDRVEIGRFRDVYAIVGGDFGLVQALGVPAARAIVGLGWQPREHDEDHDGVPDDVDQCPGSPEDRDGFEDEDGCPDIDNDDDGILDRDDACPNVKGVASPDPRKNGCPAGDRDHDGIPDDVDACPDEPGEPSTMPGLNGCPQKDRDGDGIPDYRDKCPDQPEDKDGFEDDDGCPDPDNDGDGIMDVDDACPDVKGDPSVDPKLNGCPSPDRDGDTIPNDVDLCPDAPETFNGKDDEDGCPDEGGKALVSLAWDEQDHARAIFARPIKFTGPDDAPEVSADSVVLLRALALELHKERGLTIAVAARPQATRPADEAQANSLARAFAVVRLIGHLTGRDGVAETVSWDAVKKLPSAGAEPNVNFLFLSAPAKVEPQRLPLVKGP